MSRALPWREMAHLLAERMSHHAFCDKHPEKAADPDHCPFCADRAAYRVWQLRVARRGA